jgi:hypothetical protein
LRIIRQNLSLPKLGHDATRGFFFKKKQPDVTRAATLREVSFFSKKQPDVTRAATLREVAFFQKKTTRRDTCRDATRGCFFSKKQPDVTCAATLREVSFFQKNNPT